jgi:7-cyano-7-deazaguanine synthase
MSAVKTALLLSGGMDSVSIAYWLRPQIAITVDYGHRPAQAEIRVSKLIAQKLGLEHHVVRVDCGFLGSGDLAGSAPNSNATHSDWWPYRNQLLVTLAAMKAIALKAEVLLIGTVKSDGASHIDGTRAFVDSLNQLLVMQEGGMRLEAPAIDLSTAELVVRSKIPLSFLAWAHSCHRSDVPCGSCRGCYKYAEVFDDLQAQLG